MCRRATSPTALRSVLLLGASLTGCADILGIRDLPDGAAASSGTDTMPMVPLDGSITVNDPVALPDTASAADMSLPQDVATSLSVMPGSSKIRGGATRQFTATVTYSDGSTQDVTSTATWSTSSATVATVSAGLATGGKVSVVVPPSTTMLTATMGALSATAVLTVTAPTGTAQEFAIPTLASVPNEIVAGPDGNLWFTESHGGKIGKITPSAGAITEFAVPSGGTYSITTGPDGNLWFTEYGAPNKIGKITTAGAVTEFTVPTANSDPFSIVPGSDGNLWFVEGNVNKIARVTPSGAFTEFAIPTAAVNSYQITPGPDGNLWFSEADVNSIGRITTAGAFTEFAISMNGFRPAGIVAGPDGMLWMTGTGGVGRITSSGTSFTAFATSRRSYYISAGPDGNLWTSEYSDSRIGRITPAGVLTEYPTVTPNAGPNQPTAGPDGNLWFTESGNGGNKIAVMVP